MVRLIIILFLFSSQFILLGQEIKCLKYDTSLVFNSVCENEKYYYELECIENSPYKIHYRFNIYGTIIDIFSNDSINYKGILTNRIRQYHYFKNKQKEDYTRDYIENVFVQKVELREDKIRLILNYINNVGFNSTTPKKFEPSFELIQNGNYYKNLYFNSLNEHKELETNNIPPIDYLYKNLKIDSFNLEFHYFLPRNRTYSLGFSSMYTLNHGNTTIEDRRYMYSVKDTVNMFLKQKLEEILKKEKRKVICSYNFYVTFNTKGKYSKIHYIEHYSFVKDYLQILKCKKRLKGALRNIKIDFISPRINYQKSILFDSDGNVDIY
jgi:hypothetical protein